MILGELRRTIGPYQVEEVLGHGGMAAVYKAVQPELDRTVAIKVLLPAFANDAEFRVRFQREARLVARLRHPHIVGIYSVGEDKGAPYLVMEYLHGTTLHAAIRQRRQAGEVFSPAEALDLLKPLASALDYAHSRGVIHRDLKPENIILTANGPVITDFGLAKLVQEEAATVSVVMGTPAYMAPEQIEAQPVDGRTDVYALGILLYELLTGRVPFTGSSPVAVAQAHLSEPVPALASLRPDLLPSPELEAVARRAIAKRKADRWPSPGAMITALAHAVDDPTSAGEEAMAPVGPSDMQASRRPALPVFPSPARLPHPPAIGRKAGWLFLVVPLVAVLLGGLWAAGAWARRPAPAAPPERAAAVMTTVEVTGTTVTAPTTIPNRTVPGVAGGTSGPAATSGPTTTPDTRVRGIVRAQPGANLRSGPGTGYPIVGSLPDTASVTALNQADGWLEVMAESGERGWIATDLIVVEAGDVVSLPRPVVQPPPPTALAPTAQPPTPAPPAPAAGAAASAPAPSAVPPGTTIRLEDPAFVGGHRNRGASVYGGRTASWVYGQNSGKSSMSATFNVGSVPAGTAALEIVGMDSEDSTKTPMRVAINGVVIFEGRNPLPNDDLPLTSGRWGSLPLTFDAALLHSGANTITITNLGSGGVGLPPFVAVDYALIRLP